MQAVGRVPDSKEEQIQLDNGESIRIRKWSMRKSLSLGRVISSLFQNMLGKLREMKRGQYEAAVQRATADGLAEDHEDYPDAADYEDATEGELLGVLPDILEEASEQFALLIAESIVVSNGARKWDQDDVLDEMTFGDFPTVVEAIARLNFSGDSVGKWKRLLSGEAFKAQTKKPDQAARRGTRR